METAIDKLKAEFIHIDELCTFLGITKKRCQDRISIHKQKNDFMTAYKAAAGVYYFKYEDVKAYLESQVSTSETLNEKEETD